MYTVAIAWRGLSKLSSPTTSPCGNGTGKYDGVGVSQADVYRRVLVMEVFITELS